MAYNNSAVLVKAPINKSIVINAANANRDGTSSVELYTCNIAEGVKVFSITIHAQETTTAGTVRVFIEVGGNKRLFREVEVPVWTADADEAAFCSDLIFNGVALPELVLANTDALYVCTEKAEDFAITMLAASLAE